MKECREEDLCDAIGVPGWLALKGRPAATRIAGSSGGIGNITSSSCTPHSFSAV